MKPPTNGPADSPVYTAATLRPSALPLSCCGNTDVRIAIDVPKIIEPPTPCKAREIMSHPPEGEIAQNIEATTSTTMPIWKIFFLPCISAILPKGKRKAAAESRYAVATQFKETASNDSFVPIEGSATLIEDEVKGVRKLLIMAIASATFLLTEVVFSNVPDSLFIYYLFYLYQSQIILFCRISIEINLELKLLF